MSLPTFALRSPVPWNKGKLIGPKPPLKLREVWAIRIRLQLEGRRPDVALFNLAIDSKLRGCDLVRLRVIDLAHGGRIGTRATIMQRKTQRPVQFELSQQTREAVIAWVNAATLSATHYLFPGRGDLQGRLSTRQYARLVERWVAMVGVDPIDYRTHSMRRTKATLIYQRTKNLRAIQLLLGHTKLESIVRYLGIEVEDALDIAEKTEV